MKGRIFLGIFLVGIVSIALCGQALGGPDYPTKPIELIVPWGPGGGTDLLARVVWKYFTEKLGVTISVINKPGGSGIPAIHSVMQSRADGYTMLTDTHGASSMVGAFSPDVLPFDWRKRTWCGRVSKDLVLYQVKMDSPWKTLKDVAEFARKNPEKFRWGTAGRGSAGTPALAQFFRANNLPIEKLMKNQVMFKSGKKVTAGLAGGHIHFCGQQLAESYGLIEGKKNRPIAVIYEKRLKLLPDVPTVAEAGYPMLDACGWHGIAGPPGLPKEVVDFWVGGLKKASKDPAFEAMLLKVKKVPAYLSPEEEVKFVEGEYKKYVEIAKYLGWRK
jgi:tripartite-type tricarboxylate transporter receptor subunit TctC